jgi:DNA-binding CsgD family transcriptional regulator
MGHNAEADHIVAGTSIIAGKLGEKIASDLVTIIDDATISGKWGTYSYDSEGTPAARRIIIENGVLKGYMHSLETAAKLGMAPNGSARAQDYHSRPIVRMSNTFIQPGNLSFEDLIKDIGLGVYLKGGEYGYVFSERGQYTCHAGEAVMIRNGQLAESLRDSGDKEAAMREFRAAHEVFARLGAQIELDAVRTQIRELGARPPSRTISSGMAGLTGRELEIARMVARRKSNKEIGAALDISSRTVSTHLSNIFGKVGVTSRGELADYVRANSMDEA